MWLKRRINMAGCSLNRMFREHQGNLIYCIVLLSFRLERTDYGGGLNCMLFFVLESHYLQGHKLSFSSSTFPKIFIECLKWLEQVGWFDWSAATKSIIKTQICLSVMSSLHLVQLALFIDDTGTQVCCVSPFWWHSERRGKTLQNFSLVKVTRHTDIRSPQPHSKNKELKAWQKKKKKNS